MALEYYESDYEYKNGVASLRFLTDREIDYGSFAVDYVTFLMTVMESIPDISAQYTIARLAIGLFQFDLNRDINRRQLMFSPIILGKIQPIIERYPEEVREDLPQYLQDLIPLRTVFIDSVKYLSDPKNHVNLNLKFANLGGGSEAAQAVRQIARGDRVITNKGYWGTVMKVVGTQAVMYVDENIGMEAREGEINIDTAELAIQVDKFRNVVPNMKMRDYQCEELEVKEVFADGSIRAYYKKHKKSFALKIYPDGIPYSIRFKERGRECDM
jgi:preprotein translocase subunit YajC